MEYEQKDNEGALFKNDKKETDSHPDYKGSAMINGTDYWVSGWINTSKAGAKYMKFSYTAKEQAHNNGVQQVKSSVQDMSLAELDEDIPFQNPLPAWRTGTNAPLKGEDNGIFYGAFFSSIFSSNTN